MQTELKIWDLPDGLPDHLHAVPQCILFLRLLLVRWIAVGQIPDLIQSEFLICKFSQQQMSDMDRVKCPAHDTDLHPVT